MKLAKTTLAALFCACLLTTPAIAQTTGSLRSISRVTVKPDRVAEFIEIEKSMAELMKKAGGEWRYVWRNRTGATNVFTFVYPVANYAALDAPPAWWEKVPVAQRTSLAARRQSCIEQTQTTYERTVPELTVTPAQNTPPASYLRMTRTRVRPGTANQYIAAVKEVADAIKKAGLSGYRVRRVEYGGPRSEFTTTVGFDKMTDLDGDSLMSKALGGRDAVTKWQAKVSPLVAFSEYQILTYVADLSYSNPAQ